jgi:hypothetical protein
MKTNDAPNLFVVGIAKSGTTSLYQYLNAHPDVYMSPIKEPHYFSDIQPTGKMRSYIRVMRNREAYFSLFEKASHCSVIGEASTSYFWDPAVPYKLVEHNPTCKIIVILRDPVERAYSHYLNDVREGVENRTFDEAILDEVNSSCRVWGKDSLYVNLGLYFGRLKRFKNVFGENMKTIEFEKFVRDTRSTMESIFEFLSINPALGDSIQYTAHNTHAQPRTRVHRWILKSSAIRDAAHVFVPAKARSTIIKHLSKPMQKPSMSNSSRKTLVEYYAADVRALKHFAGLGYEWKNFN